MENTESTDRNNLSGDEYDESDRLTNGLSRRSSNTNQNESTLDT